MNFDFRKARIDDMHRIWEILQQAILRRKKDGSSQWQDGYPNPDTIREDIDQEVAYVLTLDGETVGYSAVMINNEPAYDYIKGAWLGSGDYIVFHRVAIAENYIGKGLSYKMLEFIEAFARDQGIQSVRADTNYDNMAMLKIFARMGYVYCGEVLMRGSPRRAYEKVLHSLN